MAGSIGEVAAEMRVDSKEAINGVMQYKSAAEIADKSVTHLTDSNEKLTASTIQAGISWKEFVAERMGPYMKEMGGHGAAIKRIAEEWRTYKESVQSAGGATARIPPAANQATAAFTRMAGQAGQARNAMVGINYIIQDLPYGFRGVANNIDMTVQQMGMLVSTSGGMGGAFKALMATLSGPSGVLFAFSALSSILLTLDMRGSRAKETIDDLADTSIKAFIGELSKTNDIPFMRQALADMKAVKQILEAMPNPMAGMVVGPGGMGPTMGLAFLANKLKNDADGIAKSFADMFSGPPANDEEKKAREEILAQLEKEIHQKSVTNELILKARELTIKYGSEVQKTDAQIANLNDRIGEATGKERQSLIDQRDALIEHRKELMKSSRERAEDREKQHKKELAELEELIRKEEERDRRKVDRLGKSAQLAADEKNRQESLDKLRSTISIGSNTDNLKRREAEEEKIHKDNEAALFKLMADEADFALERTRHENAIAKLRMDAQKRVHAQELADLDEFMNGIDKLGNAIHRAFKDGGDELIQMMLAALQIAAQIKKNMSGGKSGDEPTDIVGLATDVISIAALFAKTNPTKQIPTETLAPEPPSQTAPQERARETERATTQTTAKQPEPAKVEPRIARAAEQIVPLPALVNQGSLNLTFRAVELMASVIDRQRQFLERRAANEPDAPRLAPPRMQNVAERPERFSEGEVASRARFRDVQLLDPNITVVIEGALDGQTFFKKNEPKYARFKKQKST